MSRRVLILGATGSIGRQAIDVASQCVDVEVVGLMSASRAEDLLVVAGECGVSTIGLLDEAAADSLGSNTLKVVAGPHCAKALIEETEPDIVLNAIVGFAGLSATIASLDAGCDLALANKESLVAGGELVMELARAKGASVLPVDSEHAALAQLLSAGDESDVERVTLTASGGPFRGYTRESLADVTVTMALAHPTWSMGGKISIDSATLMNKGLELIEAQRLFGLPVDRIGVVVHPQSIVHALVTLRDSVELAHMGLPDMRAPIAWALSHPERAVLDLPRLDLATSGRLDFEQADRDAFRCLALAEDAARAGGGAPIVLNGANEIAVSAFMDGRIGFTDIDRVIEVALEEHSGLTVHDFDGVYAIDTLARESASRAVDRVEAL